MNNPSKQRLFSSMDSLRQSNQKQGGAPASARASSAHDSRPLRPWTAEDPLLRFGQNGSFFGLDFAHPEDIRNLLVLGETGAGKTVSAVIPYLRAALSYTLGNDKRATVFVVDPKGELRETCETFFRDAPDEGRFIVLGENTRPVRFFPLSSPLGMADRREKLDSFLPLRDLAHGDHAYWHQNSMSKIYALMHLQYEADRLVPGERLFNGWASRLGIKVKSRSSWVVLKAILEHSCEGGRRRLKEASDHLKATCSLFGIDGPEADVLGMYTASEEGFAQFLYVLTCATPVLALLTDECLDRYVDLDPVPDPSLDGIDISALVEQGKVILIQPENRESARIAARAVKGKIYEAVFARTDLERPVFTVVDEFQRFVSSDPETGEQAYLDRCRGYRGMVLLATQTLASLKHALGSNSSAQSAVEILLANSPSKIVMRTTDETTLAWLRAVLPGPPTPGPHVVDVHRPLEFTRGKAYFVQANGSWALRQATLG